MDKKLVISRKSRKCIHNIRIAAEAAYLVGCRDINNTFNTAPYFQTLRKQGYILWKIVEYKRNGFNALVLRNSRGGVIISIGGTDLWHYKPIRTLFLRQRKKNKEISLGNMLRDLTNDLQVIFKKIPRQYQTAVNFVTEIVGLLQSDYSVIPASPSVIPAKAGSQNNQQLKHTKFSAYNTPIKMQPFCHNIMITGHSLGGLLAQLVAVRFGMRTIVFDTPGAQKIVCKLLHKSVDVNNICIINAFPNFINSYGTHLKTPVALYNGGTFSPRMRQNFLATFPQRASERRQKYLVSHSMLDILGGINKNDTFKTMFIESWPKNLLQMHALWKKYSQG